MINTYVQKAEKGHSIAEFMVLPKYRRRGIGSAAAHQCFLLHDGYWEVSPARGSQSTFLFWKSTIGSFTQQRFGWEDTLFTFRWKQEG